MRCPREEPALPRLRALGTLLVLRVALPRTITLEPFHLPVVQIDRRRPAKNVDHHGDAAIGLIRGLHFPFEVLEGSFRNLDAIAMLYGDDQLRRFVGLFL